MRWLAVAVLLAASCGDDPIAVRKGKTDVDYNHGALMAAIDKFVAGGRSVAGYGQLANDALALRPGMDETVAAECELQLLALALGPIESLHGQPPAAQTAALATTVWPIALAPPFDVLAADGWRDPREAPISVKAGEDARAYVLRQCADAYATDCKYIVPEWQGAVLGTEAIARMTQRVRAAVANCPECTDPKWHEAVARWETLDHEAAVLRRHYEDEGATSRWPVAGAGATPIAGVALDVDGNGEWRLDPDPNPIGPDLRAIALGDLHPDGGQLGVHLRPDARVAILREVLATAASAGFATVCVGARADQYPWEMRGYCLPAKGKPPGRPGDTVQVFLRSRDFTGAAAGPAPHP